MDRKSRPTDLSGHKPLRLWPGVVIVVIQWLLWLVVPKVLPGNQAGYLGALAGLAGGLLVVLWWLLASRARWPERLGAVGLMAIALFVTQALLHPSMATAGMGMLFYIYAVPWLSLTFVAWAILTRHLPDRTRRWSMAATIVLTCLPWTLARTGGISGAGTDFAWRWSPTPEERLLAEARHVPTPAAVVPASLEQEPQWPGFRGPNRDSVIRGIRIVSDWSASPPVELWHRPIGPGWSSFAVLGGLLYTQEQRGEEEVVSCYRADTGEPVWQHRDSVRFWEANAGAGPRATPTLHAARVYTLGATGILNALDAASGAALWSRDVAADTDTEIPYWGFSGSPLVVDGVLVVAAAGQLAGYDLDSGEPRWLGPEGGAGYSSPQLLTIDGVSQVLLLSEVGIASVAAIDGSVLWEYPWKGYPVVQPAQTVDGDLLIAVTESSGLRRVAVDQEPSGWALEERWTSNGLKPYFNDFVVHEGHAYGFDGGILSSIDLDDGERRWKGGRYGQGQLLLLADQDLLLVLSERGELALVEATPERFSERARWPALEGKTWNHPVLVGDTLLVRNAEEMAAVRLSLLGD